MCGGDNGDVDLRQGERYIGSDSSVVRVLVMESQPAGARERPIVRIEPVTQNTSMLADDRNRFRWNSP